MTYYQEDRHIREYKEVKKMSKEALKNIIDLVPDEDIETLYRVVIKFIPEDKPEADELAALEEAKADNSELTPHDAINWD